MKALVLNATHQPLDLEERPAPKPGAGQVVVRMKAASLNRRDYWITQGQYPGIEPPVILGSDGAGTVLELGEGVSQDWLHREVIINPGVDWGDDEAAQSNQFTILGLPQDGTFATELLVSASQLHAKPAHLNWEAAAALPLAGVTAYRAVFSQGNLKPGQTVLITGIGGGVATFALQFAVAAGANVWVTSSSLDKINRAIQLGAKGGFNYREESWGKEAREKMGAPNLIIDSAAGKGYTALLNLAAPGARIVNYGATAGPPEKIDMFKLFWKQLQLIGTTMGSPADFSAMLDFVEARQIQPIVDATFPLEEGNTAIEQMEKSPQFGKYVLKIS